MHLWIQENLTTPLFQHFVVLSKITLGLSSVFSQVKSNVDFVDKRLLTVNQQNKTAVTNSNGANVLYCNLVFLSKYLL